MEIAIGDPVRNPRYWLGVEGIVWWTKHQPLPTPIFTTGPASDGSNAGALGLPNTISLNQPFRPGAYGGERIVGGIWFNPQHTVGIDGDIFILGQQHSDFGVAGQSRTSNFVINEPVAGAPFNTQVVSPGLQTGSATASASLSAWRRGHQPAL